MEEAEAHDRVKTAVGKAERLDVLPIDRALDARGGNVLASDREHRLREIAAGHRVALAGQVQRHATAAARHIQDAQRLGQQGEGAIDQAHLAFVLVLIAVLVFAGGTFGVFDAAAVGDGLFWHDGLGFHWVECAENLGRRGG